MKTSLTVLVLVLLLSILAGCAPGPNPSGRMALGDVESALGYAGHEIEFGPLATMLGVFDDDAAAAVGWKSFASCEFAGAVFGVRSLT